MGLDEDKALNLRDEFVETVINYTKDRNSDVREQAFLLLVDMTRRTWEISSEKGLFGLFFTNLPSNQYVFCLLIQ